MGQRRLPIEYSVEELDRELVARAALIPGKKLFKFKDAEGTPQRDCIVAQLRELHEPGVAPLPNKALSHICTADLIKTLMYKAGNITFKQGRGIWYCDDRKDFYEIQDKQVKKNANCVAAICMKDTLVDSSRGLSLLKVKNYGKSFNLCDSEPFLHQPTAAGHMCTGFLVAKDVIATAAHFAKRDNVTSLRIVFGYKMSNPCTPVTRISNGDIYEGVRIIDRIYNRMGNKSDWALVKLNRNVEGQTIAVLSDKDISCDQSVYVIGHPCGLPLKYAPGASVQSIDEAYFGADLDIYSGNSGSPVFASKTHEVIGMVVRGDNRDFRWTGKGWISVIYPNRDIHSRGAECTKINEFKNTVAKL